MDVLVSVLIITYNHEPYIKQAMSSVINQKVNFGIEILIGDDFSTDATGKIIEEFKNNNSGNIIVFNTSANLGAVKNEHRLMLAAKGKYIAVLEGDDYWTDPLKLQKQIDFLETHPDYGLTHSDVNHYYDDKGNTEYHVNRLNGIKVPNGFIFTALIAPDPLFIKTATVCFRKELMLTHFDYELAIKENWPLTDLPLWMDITYHSKAYYFDEVFATYRLLNESASRTSNPQKKYHYHQALYKIKQLYVTKYKCSDAVSKILEENYHRGLIKIAYRLNDYSIAVTSINYLKNHKLKITQKEKLLVLATKNRLLGRVIAFAKNIS